MALNELVNRYQSKMLRYVTSLEGRDDAGDVMQETWIVVLHALQSGSYKEQEHFDKYIKGVAYKLSMKQWNKTHPGNVVELPPDLADDAMRCEEALIEKESEAELMHYLKKIGRREALIFVLHALRKKSFKVIAVMLHIRNVGSVRSMYIRAVEKLSRLVAEGKGAL